MTTNDDSISNSEIIATWNSNGATPTSIVQSSTGVLAKLTFPLIRRQLTHQWKKHGDWALIPWWTTVPLSIRVSRINSTRQRSREREREREREIGRERERERKGASHGGAWFTRMSSSPTRPAHGPEKENRYAERAAPECRQLYAMRELSETDILSVTPGQVTGRWRPCLLPILSDGLQLAARPRFPRRHGPRRH